LRFYYGLVYGLGYCPLTDWHWRVKTARGQGPLPQSLVKYYLDAWTGANSDPFWIDVLTVSAFTVATLLNSALMWRGHRRRQQATRQASQHTVT